MTGTAVPTALATGSSAWEPAVLQRLGGRADVAVVRRCVDLADLLAAAGAGTIRAALVGSALHRIDRESVARLRRSGVGVVGLIDLDSTDGSSDGPGDVAARRLESIGIAAVLRCDASGADLAAAIVRAAHGVTVSDGADDRDTDNRGTGASAAAADPTADAPARSASTLPGKVVAVWGPTGAPGRTTVAVNLAAEVAAAGSSTILADADTYGASCAQLLGLLDEAPGLAAATRAANLGRLDAAGLVGHARQLTPGLRVLTGLPRPDRWPELRPDGLEEVWRLARQVADVTVVDCGFGLEQDEELSFDVAAPRRNGATLTTLERADLVLAVGSADPVGLQRLVRGVAELREAVPGASVRVVVNRVRRSLGGGGRDGAAALVRRHTGVADVNEIPDGPDAVDAALLAGRALLDVAPRSPVRQAIRALAESVLASLAEPAASGGRDPGRHRSRRGLRRG